MNTRKFIVSFGKHGEVPVLVVGREQKKHLMNSMEFAVERVVTGDDAVKVWETLTGKKETEE